MLRKTVIGLMAIASLMVVSAGTASAHPRYGNRYYRAPYRAGYAPPVYVAPAAPVYGYPGAYAYPVRRAYRPGPAYGYPRSGVGIQTPGFGFYVR